MTTKIHMLAGGPNIGLDFWLSPGQAHDAPAGRKLLKSTTLPKGCYVVMDKGYADQHTRKAVRDKECKPVVPPKSNMKKQWRYSKAKYRWRNEIERLFHRLKNFRRVATRYDKLDITFAAFVRLGLILLLLKEC